MGSFGSGVALTQFVVDLPIHVGPFFTNRIQKKGRGYDVGDGDAAEKHPALAQHATDPRKVLSRERLGKPEAERCQVRVGASDGDGRGGHHAEEELHRREAEVEADRAARFVHEDVLFRPEEHPGGTDSRNQGGRQHGQESSAGLVRDVVPSPDHPGEKGTWHGRDSSGEHHAMVEPEYFRSRRPLRTDLPALCQGLVVADPHETPLLRHLFLLFITGPHDGSHR